MAGGGDYNCGHIEEWGQVKIYTVAMEPNYTPADVPKTKALGSI